MYNFTMIGRNISEETKLIYKIVWVRGTIQTNEQDKDAIVKHLKESIEKVVELQDPQFHWRDVTLSERVDSDGTKGINIKDIEQWKKYCVWWDERRGIVETSYASWKIQEFNDELSKMQNTV